MLIYVVVGMIQILAHCWTHASILMSYWLEISLNSLPCRPLHRIAHNRAVAKKSARKRRMLATQTQKWYFISWAICCPLEASHEVPLTLQRTPQKREYQKEEFIGRHVTSCLPFTHTFVIKMNRLNNTFTHVINTY